ncbi:MAG: TonB-dependent receptor [Bacteroidales bacterium]|nr:TonB-dependent receptor [Bacteroidales bacterium]
MSRRILSIVAVLCLLFVSVSAFAQKKITVSGVVTDDSGAPAVGAAVMIEGSSTGTVTDNNGRYSIQAPSNSNLVFSSIGMETKTIPVDGRTSIDVALGYDTMLLESTVVVGYGTQRKGSITGSVAAVGGEQMIKTKNENPQNMLTGRVAGVRVWQRTAEPGQYNASLDIRGMGSPLVVIDGVPRSVSDFQRLTPNDIDNISILKDASAAIYGVRGGNGVILVTTKKGAAGKAKVSYDGNFTFQTPASLPRQMDAINSMLLTNEGLSSSMNGTSREFSEELIQQYRDGILKGTDWNSLIIQNMAPQTHHNLTISGGDEKIQYYVGFDYLYQEGFWKSRDTQYNKYNLRSNISAEIARGLKFDLNLSGYIEDLKNPLDDPELIIRYWWKQSTIWQAFADPEQTMLNYQDLELEINSLARINSDISGHRNNYNKNLDLAASLNYDFGTITDALQGLQLKGMFSWDYWGGEADTYRKEYYQYAYNAVSETYEQKLYADSSPSKLTRIDNHHRSWLAQAMLSYDRTFDKHRVGAMMAYEEQKQYGNGFNASGELAFSSPYFTALAVENQKVSQSDLYEYSYHSLIGRLNYAYADRYLLEAQFRYDGSSRFYKGHQWGFFPSVSAGWRISQEDWFKTSPLSFINQLKLRASYGVIGSDGSNYEWATGYTYPAMGPSTVGYYNTNEPLYYVDNSLVMSAAPKALANENVTWYTNRTFDAGVDFEAWKGLFGFSFDFFRRERSGLLARNTSDQPTIVGATAPLENLNSDSHIGLELELSHRNRIGDFNYNIKGLFAITRNKYIYHTESTKYANSYDEWMNNRMNNRYQGIIFGYEVTGQYQSWEDIWDYDMNKSNGLLPGDFKYLDWNGDGTIDGLDVHPYAYSTMPIMNYSLSFDGSWKSLDFSILFQGAALGSVAYGEPQLGIWGQHGGGMLEQFYDRWHPQETDYANIYDQSLTWIPGTYSFAGRSAYSNSNFNTQPITYLRLKSIEVGYTLTGLQKRTGLGLRLYANAYNPFTITTVKYIDPEHPADSYGRLYPLNKSYTIGLNINF